MREPLGVEILSWYEEWGRVKGVRFHGTMDGGRKAGCGDIKAGN